MRALELAGYRVEDALSKATQKDAGLTPAQLGWVLSQMEFDDELSPPGGVSVEDLRTYLATLIDRLARLSFPVST